MQRTKVSSPLISFSFSLWLVFQYHSCIPRINRRIHSLWWLARSETCTSIKTCKKSDLFSSAYSFSSWSLSGHMNSMFCAENRGPTGKLWVSSDALSGSSISYSTCFPWEIFFLLITPQHATRYLPTPTKEDLVDDDGGGDNNVMHEHCHKSCSH